ncbi:MAG: cysteine rich repeat-containing protein [Rhodospirillales bacterium]|nr:cysteine rich repeat-containing protein [Rhodospirillales bacterium]
MTAKIVLVLAVSFALAAPAFAQQGQGGAVARELRSACQADAKKHCDGIQPGGGRLLQCLKGKQAELSQPCQAALGKLPAR